MTIPDRYYADIPPGFDGIPVLYLVALFATMMIVLLSLEWTWRIVWSLFERPAEIKHPSTSLRTMLVFLLVSVILRAGPNLVWMALWRDTTPLTRWWMLRTDAMLDVVSFVPFSIAWLIAFLTGPMILSQLSRHPLPLHLWPTKSQLARPLKIGVAVLAIAAAVVFAR